MHETLSTMMAGRAFFYSIISIELILPYHLIRGHSLAHIYPSLPSILLSPHALKRLNCSLFYLSVCGNMSSNSSVCGNISTYSKLFFNVISQRASNFLHLSVHSGFVDFSACILHDYYSVCIQIFYYI